MLTKTIECTSEIGITVGLIDTIINSFQLLLERDLNYLEVQEALQDLHENKLLRLFIAKALGFNADNLNRFYQQEILEASMEGRKLGERSKNPSLDALKLKLGLD